MKKPRTSLAKACPSERIVVAALILVCLAGACRSDASRSAPASGGASPGTAPASPTAATDGGFGAPPTTAPVTGFVGPPTAAADGRFGVYTIRDDGGDVKQIYAGDQARNHAHVSPDGTMVVFSEFNQDLNNDGLKDESDLAASDIAVMNIDGSGYRPISQRYGYDLTPVWSPDGRSIVYSSDRDNARGVLDLFVYDLDSERVRNLTKSNDRLEGDPNWVGGKIVFNRLSDGVMTLWIMDQDGQRARQLTAPVYEALSDGPYPFGDFDPKLSPDGRTVAFERHVDNDFTFGGFVVGRWDLMLIDANGGQTSVLVGNGDANSMPTWSADGGTIAYWAFLRQPVGASRLFTVPARGGRGEPLAGELDDLQAQMPDWYQTSTGERRIIFSAMR